MKFDPDYMIWCETWLEKDLTRVNCEYEAYQTKYEMHQSIWILSKRRTTEKIFKNDEPYILALKSNKNKNDSFILGPYLKKYERNHT